MREIVRVTRISAPSRRACWSARPGELVAGHAGGEAEVVLDPRRRAGLPARRLALDDDRRRALPTRRTRPRRDPPGRRRRSRRRTSRPPARCRARAARRAAAAAGGRPSCRRSHARPGRSSGAGACPPQRSSRFGVSDVSHSNVTWLRSRKWRSSVVAASVRSPITIARGGTGSDASPCRPSGPLMRCAASRPTSSCDVRAQTRRRCGSCAARRASRATARRPGTRPGRPCRA